MNTAPSLAVTLANDITDQLVKRQGTPRSSAFLDYVWRFVHASVHAQLALGYRPTSELIFVLPQQGTDFEDLAFNYFVLWLNNDYPGWQEEMLNKGKDKQAVEQAKKLSCQLETLQVLAYVRDKAWSEPTADALGSMILSLTSEHHRELVTAFYVLRHRHSDATQPLSLSQSEGGLQ